MIRAANRIYGWALMMLPKASRDRWAPEMSETFARRLDRSAESGGGSAVLSTTLAELANLLPLALHERLVTAPEERGVRVPGARRGGSPRFGGGVELRAAARSLRRRPGYSVLVVITLGLGIAAASALFTVVDHVLLRPLPFDPERRLVDLMNVDRDSGVMFYSHDIESVEAWRSQSQIFSGVEMADRASFVLRGEGEPEQVSGARVSAGLFSMLGAKPILGRLFDPGDRVERGVPPVVVSRGFWQRELGGDADAVGRTLRLDDRAHQVVGVVSDDFTFPYPTVQIWVPVIEVPRARLEGMRFEAIAHLQDGLSLEAANEEVARVAPQLEESASRPDGYSIELTPRDARRAGRWDQSALVLLAAATGLLLLIACANVANLGLAAAIDRRDEVALRSALGASRRRLARALLTESLLLALAGGVFGIGLAKLSLPLLISLVPEELTYQSGRTFDVDLRVIVFCLVASVSTGLLTGLVPAIRGSRPQALEALRSSARGVADRGARSRAGGALVVVQVALALLLLISAGLMIRSFVELQRVDLGFEPHGLLALDLRLDDERYPDDELSAAFFDQLVDDVEALSGVARAATGSGVPPRLGGITFGIVLEAEGEAPLDLGSDFVLPFAVVDADYFRTMGFRMVEGRGFERDDAGQQVAVLGETMARALFGDRSPIGKRFRIDEDQDWLTVVGVAADVKTMGPIDPFGDMELYRPYRSGAPGWAQARTLVVRGEQGAAIEDLVTEVKRTLWQLDPAVPLSRVASVEQLLAESLARPRFLFSLMTLFASLALTLSGIGLFAVVSYSVRRRTSEIGIRMALGALRRDVMIMVVRQAMIYGSLGAMVGVLGSLAALRTVESLLFQVDTSDVQAWLGVSVVLLVVVLSASLLPAWLAARVEPVRALRAE